MALRVLREAAGVLSPSKVVADRFAAWGIDMRVLPHGVEPTAAGVGVEPADGPIVVAVAARLNAGKQVHWVIRAVAELAAVRPMELRIMGGGPEEEPLRQLAKRLGVNATFTGQVPRAEVLRNLREAHIFALPSVSETFGLAYVEAALSGCAVIATQGTGMDGLFADGEEMLFQDGTFEHFRAALRSLIADDSRRVAMARRARERATKEYLWDAVMHRYETSYASATAARS